MSGAPPFLYLPGTEKILRLQDSVERLVIGFSGAGAAEDFVIAANFAAEIDSLSADFTGHALTFVPGKFLGWQINFDPLCCEQVVIGDFTVSEHLLLILVCDLGMELAGQRLRRFFRSDADGFTSGYVDERCGDFAPVAEFQCALAKAASGNDGDRVGSTAVDFHECNQALAVVALWIVDAKFLQAEHCEANAQDLAGADVSVGLFGVVEVLVEGFHRSCQLSAVSSQLNISGYEGSGCL